MSNSILARSLGKAAASFSVPHGLCGKAGDVTIDDEYMSVIGLDTVDLFYQGRRRTMGGPTVRDVYENRRRELEIETLVARR